MSEINLDVFTGRDLQAFFALTQQFEANGVTDIRFIRERIQEAVYTQIPKPDRITYRKRREASPGKSQQCPECDGIATLSVVRSQGGNLVEYVMACKKCRWSKYVENR